MTPLLRVVTATCFAVLSAGVVDAGVPARPRSGSRLAGPCTGTNRVGFNSYMWECPLGLYFTPSGRFYDPEAGRFLQQDSYPGDIHNPPSLHRYTFGHGNPTSFVDPTGHESYRQWILLDKPTPSVGHEFLKQFGYDAFNVLSFGALSRQDALVEQSEAGRITEGQYRLGTATNAVGTGATAAATLATGGVVGSAVVGAGGSLALAGAASGGAAGLVGSTGSADVDMATGTRSPLDVHPTEFIAPTALGAASGYALGAGPAAGGRPVGELVPAPASLNSSRAVVVAEGLGGASAADQVRLVPAGKVAAPSAAVAERSAISEPSRGTPGGRPERLAGSRMEHMNAAIAEHHGFVAALEKGQIAIQGPGKATARGPDYVTFDPAAREVVVWDAKYRGPAGGSVPSSVPAAKLQRWLPEVRSAIDSMPEGVAKQQALQALESGAVRGRVFKWPQ